MAARWMFRMFLRRRGLALLGLGLAGAERLYRERQNRQLYPTESVPPPTYSSDGHWWWDGSGWHPVTVAAPPPGPISSLPSRLAGP